MKTNEFLRQSFAGGRRWIRCSGLAAAMVATILSACSGEEGDDGSSSNSAPSAAQLTPAEQTCQAIAEMVNQCGATTPCDQALLDDCAQLTSMLNDGYLNAMTQCVGAEKKSPAYCLIGAIEQVQATTAHQSFADQFCSECLFGVPGCSDLILGTGDADNEYAAAARKVIFSLGDSLVDELRDQCTSGMTCAAEFPECAKGVLLARAIPDNTLNCMLNTLTDPPADLDPGSCGSAGSGGEAPTDGNANP